MLNLFRDLSGIFPWIFAFDFLNLCISALKNIKPRKNNHPPYAFLAVSMTHHHPPQSNPIPLSHASDVSSLPPCLQRGKKRSARNAHQLKRREGVREEHSMDQYRSGLKLSENFERHWSILISGEIHMDQSLVHMNSWGNSYGPMVRKVFLKFPLTLVLVHGWLFPRGYQNRVRSL